MWFPECPLFGGKTSVDAKHHGASLSEWWNVTWVGNNSMYTLNYNSPNSVCNAVVLSVVRRYASMDDLVVELCQMRCFKPLGNTLLE